MTIRVPLGGRHGGFALIDEDAAEQVMAFTWRAVPAKNASYPTFYAERSSSYVAPTSMHRLILSAPDGMLVDHIDFNGLNNTRANLRLCTPAENRRHTRTPVGKFGFCGVKRRVGRAHFYAAIKVGGRHHFSFSHTTAESAARAYDELAKKHYGTFAILNFPESPAGAAE